MSTTNTVKKQIYIPAELVDRITALARANNMSESQQIVLAIAAYVDGNDDDARILRKLSRLQRAYVQQDTRFEVLSEMFSVFLQMYVRDLPQVTDAVEESKAIQGRARFEELMKVVMRNLNNGGSIHRMFALASNIRDENAYASLNDESPLQIPDED